MPLYFMDTALHGVVHADPDGDDFGSPEEAVAEAMAGAAQYGADLVKNDAKLDKEERIVRTEDGSVISRFTVRYALVEAAMRK